MSRLDKLKVLYDNELSFLVEYWGTGYAEPNEVVEWFAKGGFHTLSDEEINKRYEDLTA